MNISLLAAVLTMAGLASAGIATAQNTFPQAGMSYGGKLRAGPGMDYKQVGSLREFDDIEILNGTGVMMNNYEWFRVRLRNNVIAYQWGGIMCSRHPHPTIFETCAALQSNEGAQPIQTQGTDAFNGTNGFNVAQVLFADGAFTWDGNSRWVERGASRNPRFHFVEQGRDEWSVYLYDASRNVSIQLDLHRKKILYGVGNAEKTDLYDIVGVAAGH